METPSLGRPGRRERRERARAFVKAQMQRADQQIQAKDWVLFCFAVAFTLVLFLVNRNPTAVVVICFLIVAVLAYPISRFPWAVGNENSKQRKWQRIVLFLVAAAGASWLGYSQWPKPEVDLNARLREIEQNTKPVTQHTRMAFFPPRLSDLAAIVPLRKGQIVKLFLRYWNMGDFPVTGGHAGGIIRVVPAGASMNDLWGNENENIRLLHPLSTLPATHKERDYEYRTIQADRPLTKREADDIMAYPAKKQICLLGKVHWQDATGRYETANFWCLLHEGAKPGDFSIHTAEQHDSEQVLSQ